MIVVRMVIVIVIIVLFIINNINIKNMIALMIWIMKTHLYYYHDYWSLQLQELQGLELQGLELQEEGWAHPLLAALACPHAQPGRAARGRGQNIPWGLVYQGRPMRWECPGHCEGRTLA